MNMVLFRLINGMAGKSALLDQIMLFLSQDMIIVVVSTLVLTFIFGFLNHSIAQRKLASIRRSSPLSILALRL
jgi:hypothetical protein